MCLIQTSFTLHHRKRCSMYVCDYRGVGKIYFFTGHVVCVCPTQAEKRVKYSSPTADRMNPILGTMPISGCCSYVQRKIGMSQASLQNIQPLAVSRQPASISYFNSNFRFPGKKNGPIIALLQGSILLQLYCKEVIQSLTLRQKVSIFGYYLIVIIVGREANILRVDMHGLLKGSPGVENRR